MSNKTIGTLAIFGVIGAGIYIYVKNKAKVVLGHFGAIKTSIAKISNFDAKLNNFKPFATFNVDIRLTNPTEDNFNANAVVIKLKSVAVTDKQGKLVGTAHPNISGISIPKNSSTIIKNVPLRIELFATIINIYQIIKDKKINFSEYKFEITIDVLGIEYKTTSTIDVGAFDFKTYLNK